MIAQNKDLTISNKKKIIGLRQFGSSVRNTYLNWLKKSV